ncbi:hypothetical protein Fmac_006885 [Flemingia macrophylla]|uniref:WAT1-related protein n=1 Tax=Flemingia macrophylla TaxID=520843 RepID=A0ABD1NBV6_9FABA
MAAAGFLPLLLMVLVQFVYAGLNITSKLAIQSGMNPLILAAYRQLFATMSIAPFAYWLEWNTLPRMTKPLMYRILLSSLTGQESLRIKKRAGLAKVFGTILCVSGALLLSFYHGKTIGLGQSSIHWKYAEKIEGSDSTVKGNMLIGPLALIGSTLIWAGWFIIQTDISKKYPAPYTSTGLMCFLASFQCVVIALCFDHSASGWSLHNAMRLCSALYAGVMCTGLAYCLMSWTIERKGPLYVAVFTPLQLVLTAILSWALLREKIYVGTAIGSLLIVLGLYSVLWGKSEEKKDGVEDSLREAMKDSEKDLKNEAELQSYVPSNGNHRAYSSSFTVHGYYIQ